MMHNAHHILRQYMKFLSLTIQAKSTEQYFPVVMFITLYRVVLATGGWLKSLNVTIQTQATE